MQRQEVIISQLAKVGIRVKLTALAPQQAVQAYMIEKKGSMFISPSSAYPDPSQLYEALFGKAACAIRAGSNCRAFANCSTRRWRRRIRRRARRRS